MFYLLISIFVFNMLHICLDKCERLGHTDVSQITNASVLQNIENTNGYVNNYKHRRLHGI
jgi:hypothetical protein